MNTNDESLTTKTFTNRGLDSTELRQIHSIDGAFSPLDPSYRKLQMTGLAIFGSVVALLGVLASGITFALTSVSLALAVIALSALALIAVFLYSLLLRALIDQMGYVLREKDLSYRKGLLWRRIETVPYVRVQNVVLQHGPIERHFGLASLSLRTAGGGLRVGGLNKELAERIRDYVIEQAGDQIEDDDAEG